MDSDSAWSPSATLVITATAVITASLISLGSVALWPRKEKVLPSPLRTVIPNLPSEEVEALAYHPAQFPGASDVRTPVGDLCATGALSKQLG